MFICIFKKAIVYILTTSKVGKSKIVMKGKSCCLLCLELKQEFADAIFINSVQCSSLNINNLIEKYLWTMKHITASSWLCVNCWTELYDFHNFYMRIKQAHENLELLGAKTDDSAVNENEVTDCKEAPMESLLDSSIEEINGRENLTRNQLKDGIESHIIEFKETLNDPILECPVNEIKDSVPSNEPNPLLDVEIQGCLVDTPILKQDNKFHKTKLNKTNSIKMNQQRTRRIKRVPVMEHLRDSTNKTKGNKQIRKTMFKTEMKSKPIGTVSDIKTVSTKEDSPAISDLVNEQFTSTIDSDFKNVTDAESFLSDETKPNIRRNSRTKALNNEKNKFLAENFKISCFLCDISFVTFCNLLKHFKERHNEPGYILCCDKKFYRRNVLIDHVNYHLNPNYFKCNQCDKVMEDRRRFELHCKTHEVNNGKSFCCNTCGKGFVKLAMLNAHKKRHLSEEEKRFPCHECGKNFATNYMRTNHFRATHLKKYHKICEICGKSIQDKTIFERHMLQHKGKSAPSASCDVCGLLLTDEKALERHKKVIHPEDGHKAYTCPICSKISPNLRNHKLHVRFTHESGYNYKCTICDKAFKRSQPLKEHMASHTGEILYTCPWCPKTFNSNANMHNHRKKVHPKEWEETSRKRYSGKLPPRFKPPPTE